MFIQTHARDSDTELQCTRARPSRPTESEFDPQRLTEGSLSPLRAAPAPAPAEAEADPGLAPAKTAEESNRASQSAGDTKQPASDTEQRTERGALGSRAFSRRHARGNVQKSDQPRRGPGRPRAAALDTHS
jgi:hypothetical protein